VIEIKKVSGDGVGAQYKQAVRGPGGRSIPANYTITEFVPHSFIAFQTTAGPVRPHGQYALHESGGATSVTFTLDAELTGLKKLLISGMVGKTMATEVQAIEQAKRILEG
jgi:hypothetical protein